MSVASRVFRVQKGEGSIVALVGLTFVSMVAATIGESGIDALSFDRVGAQALPVMYLLRRRDPHRYVRPHLDPGKARSSPRVHWGPLILAAVVVREQALLLVGAGWVYRLLGVTVALAGSMRLPAWPVRHASVWPITAA